MHGISSPYRALLLTFSPTTLANALLMSLFKNSEILGANHALYLLSTHILLLKHHSRIIQLNLRDRDNLRTRDKRPVPKVSFVRRFDCNSYAVQYHVILHSMGIGKILL